MVAQKMTVGWMQNLLDEVISDPINLDTVKYLAHAT